MVGRKASGATGAQSFLAAGPSAATVASAEPHGPSLSPTSAFSRWRLSPADSFWIQAGCLLPSPGSPVLSCHATDRTGGLGSHRAGPLRPVHRKELPILLFHTFCFTYSFLPLFDSKPLTFLWSQAPAWVPGAGRGHITPLGVPGNTDEKTGESGQCGDKRGGCTCSRGPGQQPGCNIHAGFEG